MALRPLNINVTCGTPKITEEDIEYALEERTKEILGILEYAAKNADNVCTQITCEWFTTHIRKKYGL